MNATLKIGNLTLKNRLITAPIAGYSDRAWRELCRAHKAALCYGEMISAQALCYNNNRTIELLDIDGEEAIRAVQLSGSSPQYLARGAQIAAERGAQLIDLNMGCPAHKIYKNGEGCAHMADIKQADSVIRAVTNAIALPVTVKFRLGLNEQSCNYLEFSQMAEAAGAAAICLHGRYREQFYGGAADWRAIAEVKRAAKIPVIGNGDIFCASDAIKMLEQTGCDFVMAARGLLGNPWLLDEILAALNGEPSPQRPCQEKIIAAALAHLKRKIELSVNCRLREGISEKSALPEGELHAVVAMRSLMSCYLKGMRNAASVRRELMLLTSYKQIEELLLKL